MKVVKRRLLSWLLAIAMIVGTLQTNTVTAFAAASTIDLSKYVTGGSVQYKASGSDSWVTLDSDDEIPYGATLRLNLDWELPNQDETALDNLDENTVFEYSLPNLKFESGPYDLKDGAKTVGEYKVENGKIVFSYTTDFLTSGKNNIIGSLSLDAEINGSNGFGNEDKAYSWEFPGLGTYSGTVPHNSDNDGLTISKSIDNSDSVVNSLEGRKVTIKGKATGSQENVTVKDTLGQYLSIDGDVTIKVGDDSKTVTPSSTTGTVTFDLGSMSNGQEYEITYTVKASQDGMYGSNEYSRWNAASGYDNKAQVSSDSVTDPKTASDAVKFNKKWLNKTSSYNSETGQIDYVITVNVSGVETDLEGMKLKDILDSNQEIDADSIQVTGLSDSISADDLTSGYTFPEDTTGTVTIKYSTNITSGKGQTTYSNQAELYPKGASSTNIRVNSANITVGSDISISKKCNTTSGDTVSWTATVKVPAGYGDFTATFSDKIGWGMTYVENSLEMDGEAVDGAESTSSSVSYSWSVENSEDERTFTFTYKTKVNDDTASGSWLSNNASFSDGDVTKNASATYHYTPATLAPSASKSRDYGASTSDGVAQWKIWLKDTQGLDEDSDELELVDTLPDGLEYVAGSAQLFIQHSNPWYAEKVDITPVIDTDDAGNTTLTFSFTASQIASLMEGSNEWSPNAYVTLQTKVSEMLEYKESKTYKNTAAWQIGENTGAEATADYSYTNNNKLLDKTVKYTEKTAPNAEYTVDVNPNGLDLNPNGDTYSLKDTTGNALDYYMGSLEVSTDGGKTYTSWTDISYNKQTRTLTINNLQDETHYVLKYKCTVNLANGQKFSDDPTSDNYAGNSIAFALDGLDSYGSEKALSGSALKATGTSTQEGKQIRIYKYEDGDITKQLSGVAFEVTDANGSDRHTSKATDSDGYTTITGLSFDVLYHLTESGTLEGYTATGTVTKGSTSPFGDSKINMSSDGIYFTFDGNDPIEDADYDGRTILHIGKTEGLITLDISNTKGESEETSYDVEISKTDVGGTEIAGAVLRVTDSTGNVIDNGEWTSEAGKSHTVKVEAGTYILTEKTAPDGYEKTESIEFTVTKDTEATKGYTITVGGETVDKVTMVDEQKAYDVVISKQDIAGEEIAGAELELKTAAGDLVTSWTSEAGVSKVISLQPGTYTLTETTAPDGYEKAESITFTVDENGKVTVANQQVGAVVMVDDYAQTDVVISKQDAATSAEIAGALLQITHVVGNDVIVDAEWTSEANQSKTVSLDPGDYTLTEITAPSGYDKAESIKFTVYTNGKISSAAYIDGKLVMKDAQTVANTYKVKISKADLNGKEINGASLVITKGSDGKGEKVASFTSDGVTAHEFSLEAGTYTLTEKTAPDGYEKAESIVFTVDENGKVKIGDEEQADATVVMTDNWLDYKVRVSKRDVAGDELEGATIQIRDEDGNVLDSWVSDGKDWEITGFPAVDEDGNEITNPLTPGTYTLVEISAPKGYERAEEITFTLTADGKVDVADEDGVIVMTDAYSEHKVKISKVDAANSKELAGATLTITGTTLAGESFETSFTTDGKSIKTVSLEPGNYTLTETSAPKGYQIAESIDFTVGVDGKVNKADANGVLVMKDEVQEAETYKVLISKQDIGGNEVKGATLTITDAEGTTVIEPFVTDGVTVSTVYLKDGNYILTETLAPAGYLKASSISFTVENGKVKNCDNFQGGEIVMVDKIKYHNVKVSKQDLVGTEIAGARLTVTGITITGDTYDKSWVSVAGAEHNMLLQAGTYTLTEDLAPLGYDKASSITFQVTDDGTVVCDNLVNGEIVMTDAWEDYEVQISKKAVSGTDELPGATLTITGTTADGATISPIQFTSGNEPTAFELQPGIYTLTEITAPDGYEKAESITFTVNIDVTSNTVDVTAGVQSTTANAVAGNTVTMKDKEKEAETFAIPISKADIAGKEVEGATLEITGSKEDGTAIDKISFTTDGVEEHEVYLPAGTYTLTETLEGTPDGYKQADPITFTITAGENGKFTVTSDAWQGGSLVMTDEWEDQKVKISKVDVAGLEVKGATLTISGRNKAGEKIEPITWTSGKDLEGNDITGALEVTLQPGSYTLTEDLAPVGYKQASSIDFEVGADGDVKVGGQYVDVVKMTDKWEDTAVEISKADVNGEEIDGAVLTLNGTTLDGTEIDEIEFRTDGVHTHTFSLQPGTYTLKETSWPNGVEKAEDITFTVEVGGKIKIGDNDVTKVVMTDKYADRTIKIDKRDIASGAELEGARLTVIELKTNTVIDKWTSGTEAHEITYAWNPAYVYMLKEVTAPNGYELLSTSIVFKVDADGNVTTLTNTKYGVVAKDGTLVIKNKQQDVERPDTGDEGDTENNGGGDSGKPKTPTAPNTTPKTSETKVPNTQTVIIVRTDEETGEGLEGGVFELYKENGEKVGTYTTDEYGIIRVDGLEPGNYYFVEIKAPEGYEALGWHKVFAVGEGDAEILAVSTGQLNANPDFAGQQAGEGGISATGDDSLMSVYSAAAAMAAAVLVLWVVARRKRQNI